MQHNLIIEGDLDAVLIQQINSTFNFKGFKQYLRQQTCTTVHRK